MKRKISNILLAMCVVCTLAGMTRELVTNYNISKASEKETSISTDADCYVICDVVALDPASDTLMVKMQNGELHEYSAYDLPEQCTLVTFKTSNLDKYESYEIVALR